MYQLALGQSARKALKRYKKSGSFPRRTFDEIAMLLMRGEPLPARCKDHALRGEFSESRECHIAFDLLLIYERNEALGIVTISRIGTHPELFGG